MSGQSSGDEWFSFGMVGSLTGSVRRGRLVVPVAGGSSTTATLHLQFLTVTFSDPREAGQQFAATPVFTSLQSAELGGFARSQRFVQPSPRNLEAVLGSDAWVLVNLGASEAACYRMRDFCNRWEAFERELPSLPSEITADPQ